MNMLEDDLESLYTILTFLYNYDRNIRGIIDNLSILAILISAAIRYTIADKYDVAGLKDAI